MEDNLRSPKGAGFTSQQLIRAGFNLQQLGEAGFTPRELFAAEFTLRQLEQAGFTPRQLFDAEAGSRDRSASTYLAEIWWRCCPKLPDGGKAKVAMVQMMRENWWKQLLVAEPTMNRQ